MGKLLNKILSWIFGRRKSSPPEQTIYQKQSPLPSPPGQVAYRKPESVESHKPYTTRSDYLYKIGNDFEAFAITLFDDACFELSHRTPTHSETNGQFVPSMIWPDLRFKDRMHGVSFWVECKFRSYTMSDGSITWCTDAQLRRYRDTQRKTRCPVYILIGIGGKPFNPARLYLVSLNDARWTVLYKRTYSQHRVYGHIRSLTQIKEITS